MLYFKFNLSKSFIILSVLLFISFFCPATIQARPGDFDPSFGNGGKVITPVGTLSSDLGYATALQPDGKIIVAGRSYGGFYTSFVVARINTDGTLDNSFGTRGVTVKIVTSTSQATAVAIQTDGKIVVGGYAYNSSYNPSFTLVRFNQNGSIDNTFGTSGYVQTNFNNLSGQITSLAIQADGKIVAAGFDYINNNNPNSANDFAIARFNSDGQLDTTFGNGGKLNVAYSYTYTRATSVVIQPDGKILVGGYGNSQAQIIRLNADGSFDNTFDGDGKVSTEGYTISSLTLQSDGKIVAAGGGSGSGVAVARYAPNGSLDTTFGTNGIVMTGIENKTATARAVKIQSDGKIVIGGITVQYPSTATYDFLSIRYNTNGSLDTSYNGSGIVNTAVTASDDEANAMVIQPDGKIVLVGFSLTSASNFDFALVRYNSDGSLDSSFDNDGISLIELKNAVDIVLDIAVQPDGKIVSVGYGANIYRDIALTRYNPDGSLDTSFGNNGIVSTSLGNVSSQANNVVIQPDGKILVSSNLYLPNNGSNNVVIRYNSDGSLDTSFGGSGIVTFGFGSNNDYLNKIILQPDGKIVAVGYADYNVALARLNNDGSLDTTFNGSGKVLTSVGNSSSQGNSAAIQTDGKIVVAGTTYNSGSLDDFLVVRYNSDGSLDTTFDNDGIAITSLDPGNDVANAVAIQSDGKIVAAGYSRTNFALVRYNADGSLDASFDGDGKVITPVGNTYNYNQIRDLVIQPNGKIVVAGSGIIDNFEGEVFRYNTDGSLDNSFGVGGEVISQIGNGPSEFFAVALQSDGKIIAGGYSDNGANFDFTLVRYFGGEASANRTAFDFDGDGKSDISVFRPDNSVWYLLNSNSGFTGLQFGVSTDKIVPADYDGDGKTDIAVYRSGVWYLNRSSAGFVGITFGESTDIPQPADFDGDGKAELVVYRPSNGTWYVLNLVSNQFTAYQFGTAEDKPVVSDYDGDGKADYAVFRPSNGNWYFQRSQLGFLGVHFGESIDKPVPADYDGDGKTDVAVFRPSNATWYLLKSQDGFTEFRFGISTDLPTAADYDGDGKADIAVFRSGIWYLQQTTAGFTGIQFGVATDKPVPNAFVQ